MYQNGYPPEWDEEVFEKVMEQAENFKKFTNWLEILSLYRIKSEL